jgi:hypothetical protein
LIPYVRTRASQACFAKSDYRNKVRVNPPEEQYRRRLPERRRYRVAPC